MEYIRLVLSLVTFFSTLAGGFFTLKLKGNKVHYFIAFSAGTLVSISFLDLLPESVSIAANNSISLPLIFIVVLVGFLAYHLLEKVILIHSHSQEDESHEHNVGFLGGSALVLHSFLDGVAIGTAFQANFQLGIIIAFAVIFHDFADGLNTVTVLLKNNSSRKKAVAFLFLDATAPVIGAFSTLLFTIPEYFLAFILAWFVGEFLYLGATDMLPSAHRLKSSLKTVLATLIGVALIFILTRFLNF